MALDVFQTLGQCGGVFAFALAKFGSPFQIGFVTRKVLEEVCARHAGIADAQLHDGALLGANLHQGVTNLFDQGFINFGGQLYRHEQRAQSIQRCGYTFGVAFVARQQLLGGNQLFFNRTEALFGQLGVWTAIGGFFLFFVGAFFFGVFVLVITVCFFVSRISSRLCFRLGGRLGNAVVGINIAVENVG